MLTAYDIGYNAGYDYAVSICFGAEYPGPYYGSELETNDYWNGVEDAIADVERHDSLL